MLDDHLHRLLGARRGFDGPLGRQADLVSRFRVWRVLGFETFAEYCRERLGMSHRTVGQRIWLERKMLGMPELRDTLASGRLTYSKALEVARGATPRDIDEWIERAATTTCQQTAREAEIAALRQNRRAGVRRIWGPRDATETVRIAIACARAFAAVNGSRIGEGEALAVMADHFASVWGEHVERNRRKIGAGRLHVLDRTDGLCAVPGCSRAAEHEHHVRFRSHGGTEDESNRCGTCDLHHLNGIHGGWMTVEGEAGEELLWRLGIQDGAPREVWITVGNDNVRRSG